MSFLNTLVLSVNISHLTFYDIEFYEFGNGFSYGSFHDPVIFRYGSGGDNTGLEKSFLQFCPANLVMIMASKATFDPDE